MELRIKDDFDLKKIENSGQCFRVRELENGDFLFISGKEVLFIREKSDGFLLSCDEKKWEDFWKSYFDFGRDYSKIRAKIKKEDEFLTNAAEFGKGIRILKQEKWEMLISFIISQRKSIPAIRTSIERLCELAGEKITVKDLEGEKKEIFLFPEPKALLKASAEELDKCGLGYRRDYIVNAARLVALKEVSLNSFDNLNDEELFNALNEFKGVGTKVANCVCLFGYGRTGRAPVDVWINKVIERFYNGENPFGYYGENAGIIQQYMFYYAKEIKNF